ncbi:MAG: hypothetical protein H7Y18_12195 [Clostridiaceae bacterium]|nr:hypothetical protein [Clostridiaceae bacterium]
MIKDLSIVGTSDSYMYFSEKKALGYEFGETWILFWIMFTPLVLILNANSSDRYLIYKGLLFIIPFFIITAIKVYIKSSMRYLLANLVIILLSIGFCFTLENKIFFIGLILFFFIISIKQRRRKTIDFYTINLLVASEFFMACLYIIALACNLKITSFIYLAAIIIAISCAIYIHLSRNLKVMEWESENSNQNTKSRKKLIQLCIAFIVGIISTLLFAAWFIGIFNFLDNLTRKILAFFNTSNTPQMDPETLPVTQLKPPVMPADNIGSSLNISGLNSLFSFIIKILELVGIIIIFLIVIYLLRKMIFSIVSFYKSLKSKGTSQKEERKLIFSLEEVTKEFKEGAIKFIKKIDNPFDVSNRKKIRKLYHKLIKSFKVKGVLTKVTNTPVEIENNINRVLHKDIKEITDIYEKARYSSQECTQEDVDRLKKFI